MIVFIILLLLIFPIVLLLLLFPEKIETIVMHRLMQFFAWTWFTLVRIQSKFYNKELLHSSGSCIIIPNHSSYLDAAIIYRTISVVFKTLGKIEITKAPLFGLVYKAVVVTVDRSSIMKRAKSFLHMTTVLEQGIDILIFPEGTFDEEDGDLKPFHDGAFRLALHAKKPLLPVLFVDARNRLHPKSIMSFTPGKCRVVYLPPIHTNHLPKGCEKEIKEHAYHYMNDMLNYCHANKCINTLEVATEWLKKNPLVVAAKV